MANSGVTHFSQHFNFKVRATCLDRGPGNHRAEEFQLQSRGNDWLNFGLPCVMHLVANVCKRSFQPLVPEHVSGILHLALSLRVAGALELFRRCLKETIESRLVIMKGNPPLEAL
eukprot:2715264-Amphidinium_carterae.1